MSSYSGKTQKNPMNIWEITSSREINTCRQITASDFFDRRSDENLPAWAALMPRRGTHARPTADVGFPERRPTASSRSAVAMQSGRFRRPRQLSALMDSVETGPT